MEVADNSDFCYICIFFYTKCLYLVFSYFYGFIGICRSRVFLLAECPGDACVEGGCYQIGTTVSGATCDDCLRTDVFLIDDYDIADFFPGGDNAVGISLRFCPGNHVSDIKHYYNPADTC